MGDHAAPAIDEGLAAGRGELLVFFAREADEAEDVVVVGLPGDDPGHRVQGNDDAGLARLAATRAAGEVKAALNPAADLAAGGHEQGAGHVAEPEEGGGDEHRRPCLKSREISE